MADISKNIEIIFGATDNIGGTISSIGSDLKSFENSIGSVTGPVAGLTKDLLKTEAAVVAVAAAYAGFAINESIKFQTAQIDLQKVLSDTDPKIESFTDTVIDLSEEYGVAAASILQGIANFKQAGFTAEEAAILQKDALDLIIAGDVGATESTEILISALKGFGVEAEKSPRFIEALNNVSNQYATNLGELAVGMARISPVAKQMGFSFEETTGLITPVIEVFRSGPEAANALKTGLLKLIDDAKPVGDALAAIGINQKDANGQMRSGKDIFYDVAEAFQTLDKNQQISITSQLVGIEQAGKMSEVFSNLSTVLAVTNAATEETGSVSKEVEARLNSAGRQVDRLVVSFNNLGKSVGDELLPGFGEITVSTTKLIQTFRDIVEQDAGLKSFFNALNSESEEFSEFIDAIAKALPKAFKDIKFNELISSFGSLKESIGDLFGDLDLTKPEDLAKALQNTVNFLTLLTNASAGVIEGLKPLIEGIVDFLEKLAASDKETQNFIGQIGGIATAIDAVLPLLGFLGDALQLIGGAFLTVRGLEALGTSVTETKKKIPGLITNLGLLATKLGPAGLVAAAGAAGVAIGTLEKNAIDVIIKKTTDSDTLGIWLYDIFHASDGDTTTPGLKNAAVATEKLGEKTEVATDRIGRFSEIQNLNIKVVNGVIEITDKLGIAIDGTGAAQGLWNERTTEMAKVMLQASKNMISYDEQLAKNAESLRRSKEPTLRLADAIEEANRKQQSFRVVLKDGEKVLETWGGTNEKAAETVKKVAGELDKLSESEKITIENTAKAERQLEALASNEKIKAMEFTARIKIADLDADAKRVEAVMQSLTAVFENTADVIGSLVVGFDAAFTPEDREFFKDMIEEQIKLQKGSLAVQKLEAETLAAKIKAQTRILEQGGAEININADNLLPELQAVLKSLIDNIRVEALNSGLEFLLP